MACQKAVSNSCSAPERSFTSQNCRPSGLMRLTSPQWRPPILMADEPTGNLDSANGAHVLELLLSLNQREGTTLVLVTHDAALAAQAGRILRLKDGIVVGDELRG